jgi:hypothetical protein
MAGGQVVYREEGKLHDAVSEQNALEVFAYGTREKEGERYGERRNVRDMDVKSRFIGTERDSDNLRYKKDGKVYPVNFRELAK